MELLDLYDNNGKKLKKIVVRGKNNLNDNENIMISIVFIQNENGKFLIQKTSKEKGGLFSTTGGHVKHAETALKAINREVKEELGFDTNIENYIFLGRFKFENKNVLMNVYLLYINNVNLKSLKLDKSEVNSVKWLSKEDINNLIIQESFLSSHGIAFKKYIASRKEVTYITGNNTKIASARQILEPLGIQVNHVNLETEELQSDDNEIIAKHSAKEVCNKLKKSIIKNDIGLYIEELNGFPGPYAHYADDTIGADGILKLLRGKNNRKAYFKEVLAYCEYGKEPITFISITKGTIARRKYGKYGWSWDFIFIPFNDKHTLAHYNDKERALKWSTTGYYELAKYLKEKNEFKEK
jgi:XTP/dITP diphosphohydrolase